MKLGVETLEKRFLNVCRKRFAATDYLSQRTTSPQFLLFQKYLQHWRNKMDGRDFLFGYQPHEVSAILMTAWSGQNQPSAGKQRPKEFPNRNVESKWGFLKYTIGL